jgi:hypothetical protein
MLTWVFSFLVANITLRVRKGSYLHKGKLAGLIDPYDDVVFMERLRYYPNICMQGLLPYSLDNGLVDYNSLKQNLNQHMHVVRGIGDLQLN